MGAHARNLPELPDLTKYYGGTVYIRPASGPRSPQISGYLGGIGQYSESGFNILLLNTADYFIKIDPVVPSETFWKVQNRDSSEVFGFIFDGLTTYDKLPDDDLELCVTTTDGVRKRITFSMPLSARETELRAHRHDIAAFVNVLAGELPPATVGVG